MTVPTALPHRRRMMAVVAFGVFVAADDLMVVATMLRPMIDDLGLVIPDDLGDAAWIVNVYLIAYIAVMPVAGRLSDVVGRRVVFTGALAVFLVGSLVVPAADTLPVLLMGRVLTAVGGGALVPIAFAVAGDLHVGPQRARAIGVLGAIETIGWVWGPLYGAILVRFLSWRWQFHLNVPMALLGMIIGWRVLEPARRRGLHVDWLGAGSLCAGLVALNVALLSEAKIQTVTGLEDLTGSTGANPNSRWLYAVAAAALALFAWTERRADEPMLSARLVSHRSVVSALVVNCMVGVGLVIALINVPLFVNIVEGDIQQSAVLSGWLLTSLTVSMAITSYLGGLAGGRYGYRLPTIVGLVLGSAGLILMGASWSPKTANPSMALQLGLVGCGIGLVLAPTNTAVVDAATDDERGTSAGLVIVSRLVGFSIGLAALTAWGLRRYDTLRAEVVLPPVTDPAYADELADAIVEVSTSALAETFIGAAIVLILAIAIAARLGRAASEDSVAGC